MRKLMGLPGTVEALSATMRMSMPRATALKNPADGPPAPTSSSPEAKGAIMRAAESNLTKLTFNPSRLK